MTGSTMAGTMTFKQAKLLSEDQHSCVKIESVTRKVNLSFKYTHCVKKGIQEILDNELNIYSENLEGAMIAYQKIRLNQQVGRIYECQPFLKFNVQVDVAVFRPYKGAMMKGTINKVGNDHIGVLIHNIFNCSLRRPRDIDLNLIVGLEVWFKVFKVYQHGGLTAVRGDLDIDSVEQAPVTKSVSIKFDDEDDVESTDAATPSDADVVVDKSHLKRKRSLSDTSEVNTEEITSQSDTPASEKKHKRRKKDKDVPEGQPSSEKKAKKRKRSLAEGDIDTSISEEVVEQSETTPSEKKRKRRKKDKYDANESSLDVTTDVSQISPVECKTGDSAIDVAELKSESNLLSPPILSITDRLSSKKSSSKKKHKKHLIEDAANLASTPVQPGRLDFTESAETPDLNESYAGTPSSTKKLKKKKKNKESALDDTLNDSIVSVGKSDVFHGSDSGISDSTPQSLTDSTKKAKKKKKSKADTSIN